MACALVLGLLLGAGASARGQEGGTAGGTQAAAQGADQPTAEKERSDDASARKAATRRRKVGRSDFDPKVFEARGRELQGEYYEIASFAKAPAWSSAPAEAAAPVPERSSSRNWFLWGGAAGLTAVVAGAAGYFLLGDADPVQPVSVHINDQP